MKAFLRATMALFHNGGLTRADYKNIMPYYERTNWRVWRLICILTALLFVTLFLSSFFTSEVVVYRYLYLTMAILSCLMTVIFFRFVKEGSHYLLKTMIYTNSAFIYAFGILLGVSSPNELSVAFMVMLVAVPLLILDKPYRLILCNTVACLGYIAAIGIFKAPAIRHTEILNTLVYYFLGCILLTYLVKTRFDGYIKEYRMGLRVYYDALTGLNSELSYLLTVEEMDEKIGKKAHHDFAVVMMDLNNVKATNDTYGHVFGCAMIVEAGHYIKKLFGSSKTFHVGGDEYIALLEGEDFENRDLLLEEFDRKMENYYFNKDGVDLRIVVARGMAVYNKNNDQDFRQVLKRADALMYENKKYVKELYGLPSR